MKTRIKGSIFIILITTIQIIVIAVNLEIIKDSQGTTPLKTSKKKLLGSLHLSVKQKKRNGFSRQFNDLFLSKGQNLEESEIITSSFSTNTFSGYNLFILRKVPIDNMTLKDLILVIVDMEGKIVVIKDLGSSEWGAALDVEFINSTTILVAKPKGAALWNLYSDKFVELGIKGHHEYEYNYFNNTLFTLKPVSHIVNETEYAFDKIVEYNITSNELIWELDTFSFVSPDQWCPFHDLTQFGLPDITHCNSIFFDDEEDTFYLNVRNLNTFFKLSSKTGHVIWALGEFGNFSLFDMKGNKKNNLFYHAHAVEKVDKNTFILFDNDYHNQTDPMNQRSRILEITIDETTMTANESWSWVAPLEYYSRAISDADRLPNGNRLGTFGMAYHPNTNTGARLVEVNDSGHIVWEMNFPNNDDFKYHIYRADRVRLSPILSAPSDIIVLQEENNVMVNWQVWYNFRNKIRMKGSYSLYLNGLLMENESLVFETFWRPINLTININNLEKGDHNLTLVVADEGNHITTDSINISLVPITTTKKTTYHVLTLQMGVLIFMIYRKYERRRNKGH